MKTYFAFPGNEGEVIVIPSITPNPDQKRIGIRIGAVTIWLRSSEALELADAIRKEAK